MNWSRIFGALLTGLAVGLPAAGQTTTGTGSIVLTALGGLAGLILGGMHHVAAAPAPATSSTTGGAS